MADIDKMKSALRAAHQAGDTASAQRIARMIKGASGGPEATAAPVPRVSGGANGLDYGLPEGYEVMGTFADGGLVYKSPSGTLGAKSKGGSTTDPETVDKIMKGQGFAKIMADRIDNERIDANPIAAHAQEFVRGVPIAGSYIDEAVGMVSEDAAENMRKTSEAMGRQKPMTTTALNVAGGVAGSLPVALAGAGGGLVSGGSRLARMGKGALVGALAGGAEGAVYGYGEQGEDGNQRGKNALVGGAFGGGLGGILGGLGPAIGDAAKGAWRYIRGDDVAKISGELGIEKNAAREIRDTLRGGDFDAMAQGIERAGPNAMLADAGDATAALLSRSANSSGQAADEIGRVFDKRVTAETQAWNDTLDDVLGNVEGVIARKGSIMKSTQADRKAAYDAAYAVEIDWRSPAGERLRQLIESAPKEAMQALDEMKRLELPKSRPSVPDSAYADEFAPAPAAKGPTDSWLERSERELAEYDAAVSQARPPQEKTRPIVDLLRKQGGVDPSGRLAEELRAQGITSRTHPALFKRGGLRDADNMPMGEIDADLARRAGLSDDGAGYVAPQSIADAVRREMDGGLDPSADRQAFDSLLGDERYYSDLRDEVARVRGLPEAPPQVGGETVPAQTVRDVDMLKRSFDRLADGERDLIDKTLNDKGREFASWAREIRDNLAEVSEPYAGALEKGADAIGRRRSVDLGTRILNNKAFTREQVALELKGLTKAERLDVRAGVRAAMDEQLANVRRVIKEPDQSSTEAVAALKSMSRANEEKLRLLLGKDEADKLFKQVDRTLATYEMRQKIALKSDTARNQEIGSRVSEMAESGIVRKAASGEGLGLGAVKEAWQAVTGETKEARWQREREIYGQIGKALTGKQGRDALAALRVIEHAIKTQTALNPKRADIVDKALKGLGYTVTTGTSGAASRE